MSEHPRPEPGAPRAYEFPATTQFTLDNGLRVIVAPMPRLPLVSVMAVIDAGASGDAAGREGLALLTASALAEGTAERDAAALADAFERLGTSIEAGADWDHATVHLTVTPTRLDEAFALLADVVMTPRFAPADVARLKAERLSDLLQQRVEPRGLADERFAGVTYAESSRFARPAGGKQGSVRALDASMVRAWHEARYAASTTTIVVTGDVTPERVRALAVPRLGAWSRAVQPVAAVDVTPRRTARAMHVVAKANAQQTELRVGHVGLPRAHGDYFKVVVMNAVLGGLFSSRINLNLREAHAYTYGAHSAFDWRRAAGPFAVSTAVKTEVTDAALREILLEIDRMRETEVSQDELELATKYLAGVFPIRYETTDAVAGALALAAVYGLDAGYFSAYRERILAVTTADVLAAARAYLHPDRLQVLAVGDADAIEGPLAVLGLGPMTVTNADDGDDA
ncbi:MAG: M16 family metallopeptidase [Gemmatimonadaceae bacterium]